MKTLFPMAPTTRARLRTFDMLLAVARRVIEGRGHCPVGVARAAMRRVKCAGMGRNTQIAAKGQYNKAIS